MLGYILGAHATVKLAEKGLGLAARTLREYRRAEAYATASARGVELDQVWVARVGHLCVFTLTPTAASRALGDIATWLSYKKSREAKGAEVTPFAYPDDIPNVIPQTHLPLTVPSLAYWCELEGRAVIGSPP
jgi:hypothetical protein